MSKSKSPGMGMNEYISNLAANYVKRSCEPCRGQLRLTM